MKWLRRPTRSVTCFCDACATVTHCDTSHRINTIRQDALTRALLHR
jgi:hypothetical protein